MALSLQAIQKGFYDWVFAISTPSIPVIWLNPNAPRPAKPYLSLNITSFDASGFDYETPPNNDGMASLFGNRELTLEINFYGNNNATVYGFDLIEKLQRSLQQYDVKEQLLAVGIHFIDRLSLLNVTELLDTKFEERHILEIRFRVSNQGISAPDLFNVGFIESVGINGELLNTQGEVLDVDFVINE